MEKDNRNINSNLYNDQKYEISQAFEKYLIDITHFKKKKSQIKLRAF